MVKIKALTLIVLIGFIIAFAYHFNAIADIDAPHNPSNYIYCGSCHGYEIFWVGTGEYDRICTDRCHSEPFCPYTDNYAPFVQTHLDSDDNKLAECRTCHDPHEHKQKLYKNTEADNLYLARGTIIGYIYNPPTPPETVGTSILTYSVDGITYKDGWNATKLTGKTEDCRRTILFPNTNKLGYSYPVLGVDEGAETITVSGDVRPAYEYTNPPSSFAVMYGQYIKDTLNDLSVKFFDKTGQNSHAFNEFAPDVDQTPNGICQVCHTGTQYWLQNGTGTDHYNNYYQGCIYCHSHVRGFFHCSSEEAGCHNGPSHTTHWKLTRIGPATPLHCTDCHDIENNCFKDDDNYCYFKSGTDGNGDGKYDLSETDVCNTCHSPGGSYNGVKDDTNGSIGAKNHWSTAGVEVGVYSLSPASQIPDWKPHTIYETDHVVMYNDKVYISLGNFLSGLNPNASRWNLVNSWVGSSEYQTSDVVTYNGNVYRCSDICTTGIFIDTEWNFVGPWHKTLQAGKEKWCIGCHDDNPATPANESALIDGVYAPNIAGDEFTSSPPSYGFFVSGHGRTGLDKLCLDCHDVSFNHIDTFQRTYDADLASQEPPVYGFTYRYGYRLNEDMSVPLGVESIETAFKLCMNCHDAHTEIFDDAKYCNTNFMNETKGEQYHKNHLTEWMNLAHWDSDWDGSLINDSAISCPACHNVHGSPMEVNGELKPNPVMIRHGELISTPGTKDKVPALDFRWKKSDDSTETNILTESRYGYMDLGIGVEDNHVCYHCHHSPKHYRTPGCAPGIAEMVIWTTDENDNPKNTFFPDDKIRYHLSAFLTGAIDGTEYCLQALGTESGGYALDMSWTHPTAIDNIKVTRGEYTEFWEYTIPEDDPENPPDPPYEYDARFRMILRIGNYECTTAHDSKTWTHDFHIIVPSPP